MEDVTNSIDDKLSFNNPFASTELYKLLVSSETRSEAVYIKEEPVDDLFEKISKLKKTNNIENYICQQEATNQQCSKREKVKSNEETTFENVILNESSDFECGNEAATFVKMEQSMNNECNEEETSGTCENNIREDDPLAEEPCDFPYLKYALTKANHQNYRNDLQSNVLKDADLDVQPEFESAYVAGEPELEEENESDASTSMKNYEKNIGMPTLVEFCNIEKLKVMLSLQNSVPARQIDKSFICDFCNKAYSRKDNLNNHVKTVHQKLKKFNCTECGKKFGERGILKKHMESVHEKVKKFPCNWCKKLFSRKDILANHVRTLHQKLKNFSCDFCGKKFGEKGILKKHVESVHQKIKNFVCVFCGKAFSRKDNLNVHVKYVHKKAKQFNCNECDKKFDQKSTLRDHVNYEHQNLVLSNVKREIEYYEDEIKNGLDCR